MKQQRIALALLLLLAFPLYGQQYDFRHFTVEHGLPSSNLYQVIQDKKGYLWFATDNGVCRYDGHSFRTFTTADGFTDYGAFRMLEDSFGRIWFMTFSGNACWYRDGKFTPFTYTRNGKRLKITWVVEDRRRVLWFGTEEGVAVQLWPDGTLRSIDVTAHNPIFRKLTHSFPMPGGVIFFSQDFYVVSNDLRVTKMPYTDVMSPLLSRFFGLKDGTVLLTNYAGVYALDSTSRRLLLPLEPRMRGEIYDIYEDNEGNIWVGSTDGVRCFSGGRLAYDAAQHMLANRRVLHITRDHEGNYWFATDNGAFMLSSRYVRVYREQEGLSTRQIMAVKRFGERELIVLARDGTFYKMHNSKLERLPFSLAGLAPLHPEHTILTSIAQDSILISITGGGSYLLDRHGLHSVLFIYPWYIHRDGSHWFYDYDGLYRLFGGRKEKIYPRRDSSYIYSIYQRFVVDGRNRCWIGTRLGLLRQDAQGIVRYGDIEPRMRTFVIDLAMSRDGSIWAATKGQGVFRVRNDSMITQITTADGLAGDNCDLLLIDDDENVWVAGFNGLSKIVVRNGKPVVVRTFSAGNILPSNDIRGIARYGDTVYVAGSEGLTVFDERLVNLNATPPPVYITRVAVAGQTVPFGETCTLDYGSGAVTVEYAGIVFRKPGVRAYCYRFSSDTSWTITQSASVQFPSLDPGTYVLEVLAQNNDGLWSTTPAVLALTVRPAYWQSWWFRGTGAALGLACVGAMAMFLLHRRDKKNALQRTLLEMELRALRSQMNPHFIFNALNSIQDFILHQQSRTANLYLTKFARLMRMILEYSRQASITLENELEFLQLYIDLEQLRFEPTFAYRLNVDPALRGEYVHIPPMILQPVVENAIKHGLASRCESGLLSISFDKRDGMLHCTVEDNGVGRREAMRLQQESGRTYTSIGLANTRERLVLAHGRDSKHGELQIADLYDADGKPAGTKVEMYLPLS